MKECRKCGQVKGLDEFYKHPAGAFGRDSKCKECSKALVQKNRAEKLEYYREYDRKRAMQPDRVAMREKYQQTDAGKKAMIRARVAYKTRQPERRAAHVVLGNAVRDGIITPQPCFVCGSAAEAHHPDYSRPLDVVWLCRQHHKDVHKMAREIMRRAA